jgi:hypothetical protein
MFVPMTQLSRAGIVTALVLMLLGCEPADRWGTPEYFERLVGARFVPASPPVRCQHESGLDVVGFKRVRLPLELAETLRRRPDILAALPRQLPYERERTLRRWTQGPLSAEARDAFELALAGALAAVDRSRCAGVDAEEVRPSVLASLAKSTTLYSYQWKSFDGRVVAEALEFRVLDPVEGMLYELVNFS